MESTSVAETLPELPEDAVFRYVGEGAANIVYEVSVILERSNNPGTLTPEPSVVEEYGDGTPPPSILDFVPNEDSLCKSSKSIRQFSRGLQGERRFINWTYRKVSAL